MRVSFFVARTKRRHTFSEKIMRRAGHRLIVVVVFFGVSRRACVHFYRSCFLLSVRCAHTIKSRPHFDRMFDDDVLITRARTFRFLCTTADTASHTYRTHCSHRRLLHATAAAAVAMMPSAVMRLTATTATMKQPSTASSDRGTAAAMMAGQIAQPAQTAEPPKAAQTAQIANAHGGQLAAVELTAGRAGRRHVGEHARMEIRCSSAECRWMRRRLTEMGDDDGRRRMWRTMGGNVGAIWGVVNPCGMGA